MFVCRPTHSRELHGSEPDNVSLRERKAFHGNQYHSRIPDTLCLYSLPCFISLQKVLSQERQKVIEKVIHLLVFYLVQPQFVTVCSTMGFPDNSVKNPPVMQEIPVWFLGQEDLYPLHYSWVSLVTQLVKKPPAMQEIPEFDPWVGKIPWRKEKLPTPVFWPGEFYRLYSPWGRKESNMTEPFSLSFLSLCSTIASPWQGNTA